MIALLIIGLALAWLGFETDWMTVRLPVGKDSNFQASLATYYWNKPTVISPITEQANTEPVNEPKSQGKWQFSKFGDNCITSDRLGNYCHINHCRLCHQGDRFFAWRIPARTVKVFGSTINFKEGCNLYRAKLLKDMAKAQKQTKLKERSYSVTLGITYGAEQPYGDMDLLVDGEVKLSVNGNGKHGMVKQAMKPYTSKVRVGRQACIIPVGEADRVEVTQ